MSLINPSSLLGLVVSLYLISFVVFAILRIATGISIQRIGYFSLRRIAYTPREGVRLDVRGIGLQLHRPTFAQPTWVSLRLTEFKVTVDPKILGPSKTAKDDILENPKTRAANGSAHSPSSSPKPTKPILRPTDTGSSRSRTWKRLTKLKEQLKKIHEKIHWLRLVDVVALNSSCIISDIGKFEIGTFNLAVDTRRKTVDRGRLFQHKKFPSEDQRPAEWMLTIKSVLFTPQGKGSLEILDICNLNVHGLLYRHLAGLRDASVSLKLGRIHIPFDELVECQRRVQRCQHLSNPESVPTADHDVSFTDVIEELDRPGSRESKIVRTVSESKEFISSLLRGVQEIQLGISFVGMSKRVHLPANNGSPLYLNVAMNEIGIDLHRLDPNSPAHRMYFSPKDIAHQALIAAISISVSLDDGNRKPDKILYIPMATTTIKTTLPSKTVAFSEDKNAAERNTNMLFSNLVVTSPSVDVDPKHIALIFELLQYYD
ncbi:MAG: hypothetical protein Q9214_004417, partial [Letrouitia sp. 1 TL-2023]